MRITLLGAGVRVPFVLRGLASRQDELGLEEVVLHDTDPERLATMSALGGFLADGWGARFAVRGDADPRAALAGARFVFAAIRPGQEAARVADEAVPLARGVLGQETTGPGGFAMALRTIPAMLGYARLLEEVAPDAMLVNFTNPVGIVVQALYDRSSARVVGVCDGPASMHRSVAAFLGERPERVHVDYAGLNHCGWIHRVLVDGRDRLPELVDRFAELRPTAHAWAPFDPALVRSIGMLPMEYLTFFYEPARAIDGIRAAGSSRGDQLARLNGALWATLQERVHAGDLAGARDAWERVMGEREATYFARELGLPVADETVEATHEDTDTGGYEGVATAAIAASLRAEPTPMILDVPNRGAIEGLDDDDVVEVTAFVDAAGVHPVAQGQLPDHASELIARVKRYERLTVRAATEGSYDAAVDALAAHPLVGSSSLAKHVLDGYVEHLGNLIPALR